jgi:hypothetical protein
MRIGRVVTADMLVSISKVCPSSPVAMSPLPTTFPSKKILASASAILIVPEEYGTLTPESIFKESKTALN